VSDDLAAAEKERIAAQARSSLAQQYWENILW
jgi:hypothetical protein